MTNDDRNGVSAEPEKIDPEEQLPDLPGPELPDLTRLYKRRCRDGDVMQRCKHMLIAGYSPGRVALLLRLPLEKVKELHQASYNPRCRRFEPEQREINNNDVARGRNARGGLPDAGLALVHCGDVTSAEWRYQCRNGSTDARVQ
jgi:hypothetical protein